MHRIRKGTSPFLPDKSHIHHKLLFLGMSQHAAMITILVASASIIAIFVFLSKYVDPTLLFVSCIALFTLLNVWMTKKIHQKNIEY